MLVLPPVIQLVSWENSEAYICGGMHWDAMCYYNKTMARLIIPGHMRQQQCRYVHNADAPCGFIHGEDTAMMFGAACRSIQFLGRF